MSAPDVLQEVVSVCRRRWLVVLGSVATGALVGASISLFLHPVFRAETVAISSSLGEAQASVLSSAGQLGGLAALAGIGLGQSDEKSEALEFLRSRVLARRFIVQHDLLPQLFASHWDTEGKVWRHRWWAKDPTLNDGVEYFRHSIFGLQEDKRTGVLRLSMEWGDRERTAEWANAYLRMANDELRKRAIDSTARSLSYLDRELQETSVVELRQGLFRMIQDQKQRDMLARTREDYAFRIVDPAVVPDSDDPVRPSVGAFAVLAGMLFGVFTVLLLVQQVRRR
ncbi:MAG: hypothetical protein CMLOHMNK_01659 [Steroidobacteraceae bacterium]|nr:hypothetical protein [Steroidobacteraceae bacterium]